MKKEPLLEFKEELPVGAMVVLGPYKSHDKGPTIAYSNASGQIVVYSFDVRKNKNTRIIPGFLAPKAAASAKDALLKALPDADEFHHIYRADGFCMYVIRFDDKEETE